MTTMTKTVKGWVAAGSSATLLVGGLVLGTPAAMAAPTDAACLQASGQFTAALAAAGITPASVTGLELAAEAVVVAEEQYFGLADAAAGELDVQLEAAWTELEAAEAAEDPEAIAAAETRIAELEAAIMLALETPEILAAEQALDAAIANLDAQLSVLALDEATAEQILVLFKQFLTACDGAGIGTPVTTPVVAPAPAAPVAPAPVVTTPAPAPAAELAPVAVPAPVAPVVTAPEQAAPVAMNPGMNMQTAATTDHEHPGAALVAALLAAGIAVPAAVTVRMHRLQRHRPDQCSPFGAAILSGPRRRSQHATGSGSGIGSTGEASEATGSVAGAIAGNDRCGTTNCNIPIVQQCDDPSPVLFG